MVLNVEMKIIFACFCFGPQLSEFEFKIFFISHPDRCNLIFSY